LAGDHSEWHEIRLSDGVLLSNGGTNDRLHYRPVFASDSQLFSAGWNSGLLQSSGVDYACESGRPNFCSLMSALSGYTDDYAGPYGISPLTADTDAMYGVIGQLGVEYPVGTTGLGREQQTQVYKSDRKILTVLTMHGSGSSTRVSPDGYFGISTYYRIQYRPQSPINARWYDTNHEWRCSFFASAGALDGNKVPLFSTSWLSFSATAADLETALRTLLGNNAAGPNAFVDTELYPITGADVPPQMIWQRGLVITLPSDNSVPPVPWSLNDRANMLQVRIQVRATVADRFVRTSNFINRIDWASGDIVWSKAFGASAYGGASLAGQAGLLAGDCFIVAGEEVAGTCYSVYRWETVGYGVEDWVLTADYCPAGKTPSPPGTPGDFIGQYKNGGCV
jgi:hypothetical protein